MASERSKFPKMVKTAKGHLVSTTPDKQFVRGMAAQEATSAANKATAKANQTGDMSHHGVAQDLHAEAAAAHSKAGNAAAAADHARAAEDHRQAVTKGGSVKPAGAKPDRHGTAAGAKPDLSAAAMVATKKAMVTGDHASHQAAFDAHSAAGKAAGASGDKRLMEMHYQASRAHNRVINVVKPGEMETANANMAKVAAKMEGALQTGAKGGQYYMTATGRKVYKKD